MTAKGTTFPLCNRIGAKFISPHSIAGNLCPSRSIPHTRSQRTSTTCVFSPLGSMRCFST